MKRHSDEPQTDTMSDTDTIPKSVIDDANKTTPNTSSMTLFDYGDDVSAETVGELERLASSLRAIGTTILPRPAAN
jgi:hypothetical protein